CFPKRDAMTSKGRPRERGRPFFVSFSLRAPQTAAALLARFALPFEDGYNQDVISRSGAVYTAGRHHARFRKGKVMASQGKHSNEGFEPLSTGNPLVRQADQSQLDFELDFFGNILQRHPEYVDVLRIMGNLLTLKGRYTEGLQ